MRLEGKRALVTGGSRGIGQAIALAFAREGADLVVTARHAESLQDTLQSVSELGRTAFGMSWDVSRATEAKERTEWAKAKLGGLDILVNNAGVILRNDDHPDETPEELWDRTMDVNLKGLYFLCQAAGEVMSAQKEGVIINIASDAGLRAAPTPYAISKWGVVGFTRGLARQLAPHGVRVNSIAPGPVATQMMRWEPGKSMDAPNLPLGRYALPEEIACVAVFLASDESAAVFGQTIVVNSADW